jgi:hypothetical protein
VEIISGDKENKRDVYVYIIRDGKKIGVQAWRKDMTIDGVPAEMTGANSPMVQPHAASIELTDEELGEIIAKRFRVMDRMVEGLVTGSVKALIISAAPGVGKTYTLEKRLHKALRGREIEKFTHLRGKITPLGLYTQLFQHSNPGQVLVFDDIDSVFADEDCLNFLKAALDTGSRNLSYPSASSWFEENGIPQEFDFEGTIAFITNKDFDRVIEKGGTMSEHFKALISRSNYLDLKVHTNREILIRIKQVIATSDLISEQGLNEEEGEMLIEWLSTHAERMRELSIRSVLKLASYMKTDGDEWLDTAETMMLRG